MASVDHTIIIDTSAYRKFVDDAAEIVPHLTKPVALAFASELDALLAAEDMVCFETGPDKLAITMVPTKSARNVVDRFREVLDCTANA